MKFFARIVDALFAQPASILLYSWFSSHPGKLHINVRF
jgi:hypothetical protein